jgi:hypothetical protein
MTADGEDEDRPADLNLATPDGMVVSVGHIGGTKVSTPLHFQSIAHPGACGKTRVVRQNLRPGSEPAESGIREVRVLAVCAA